MPTAENHANAAIQDWLRRLDELINCIREWAEAVGWSTRRIEKKMKDSDVGTYDASALLLQEGTTRILLEPVARSAPGAEGVVDLYLLPAYDDIAGLYWYDDRWHLHYMFPDSKTAASIRDAEAKELSQKTFLAVLEAMTKHAA